MIYEKIDLYAYFGLQRKEGQDGYLVTYVRKMAHAEITGRKRPGMIVVPGGGYAMRSDREAEPVALAYLNKGYSSFVLEYTCKTAYPTPLIEACMAVIYLRENAERYDLDAEHLAAIGFSAGGHLTGMLATMYNDEAVINALGERAKLARLNAVVLSYAVLCATEGVWHKGSIETISGSGAVPYDTVSIDKRVTADSVPAFFWHTIEDGVVPVENSVITAMAYKKAGVPFALHLFERGPHGVSVINIEVNNQLPSDIALEKTLSVWVDMSLAWLEDHGFQVRIA